MARSKSTLLKGLSGAVGKQLVFKQYGGKTIVSQYPNMSKVKPSELQQQKRSLFAEAVQFTRGINSNPKQKAVYLEKSKKGKALTIVCCRSIWTSIRSEVVLSGL